MKFIKYKSLTESVAPREVLDEIDEISNTIDDNIGHEVKIPKDVLNSFKLKPNLNPEVWIKNQLNPKARKNLLKIAKDFFKSLELPSEVKILEIIFTGSLANFNWSKFSDVDLHIVIDFNKIDADPTILQEFFNARKNQWNQEHDITMFDFPVELYIQDIHAKHISSAIYSVLNDRWLIEPKLDNFKLDKNLIKRKTQTFVKDLRNIRQAYVDNDYNNVVDMADMLKRKIKAMRQSGLESGGEYSIENIVFKVLRRTSFMDQLDSFKAKAYDTLMTVNEILSETKSKIKQILREDVDTANGKLVKGKYKEI